MTQAPRHQYVDPLAPPPRPAYVSTWNDRERKTFRILMITVAVFAVIMTIGAIYLVDLGNQTHDTITQGRKDRLNFQKSIQEQSNQNKKDIQALACYAANAVPRGTSSFLDGLAKKYNCPPYRKPAAAPKASVTPGSAQISPSPRTGSNLTSSATPSSSVIAKGGSAGQITSSYPKPSGGNLSSALVPTPSPSSSSPLNPVICQLLHLC